MYNNTIIYKIYLFNITYIDNKYAEYDNTYRDAIYEDLYISILLHKHDICPCEIKTKDYFISPDHV